MSTLEMKFYDEMVNIYHCAKKEINYTATRFIQLVSRVGGVQAAKILISKEGGTYGFEELWKHNRLDISVEALVLKIEFNVLFTNIERAICRDRLKEYGYKIKE